MRCTGVIVVVACAACESARNGGDAIDASGGGDGDVPVACSGKSAQPIDAVWTMTVNGVDQGKIGYELKYEAAPKDDRFTAIAPNRGIAEIKYLNLEVAP